MATLDARILVWLLATVFATGLPLMVLFEDDPQSHAARLRGGWGFVRSLHAAATLALMGGTLWHLASRLPRGSARGTRTGAWLLVGVGFAVLSGALAAQTGHAERVAHAVGLRTAPVVPAAVFHIAYATILVVLLLYMHVARWGWRRVFGSPAQALVALFASVLVAWALPAALPGDEGGGATAWLAPAWPAVAVWPVLLGLAIWGISALRRRPRAAH